jgi:hypothetical protein
VCRDSHRLPPAYRSARYALGSTTDTIRRFQGFFLVMRHQDTRNVQFVKVMKPASQLLSTLASSQPAKGFIKQSSFGSTTRLWPGPRLTLLPSGSWFDGDRPSPASGPMRATHQPSSDLVRRRALRLGSTLSPNATFSVTVLMAKQRIMLEHVLRAGR